MTDLRDQLIALHSWWMAHLCNNQSIAQQSTDCACPVLRYQRLLWCQTYFGAESMLLPLHSCDWLLFKTPERRRIIKWLSYYRTGLTYVTKALYKRTGSLHLKNVRISAARWWALVTIASMWLVNFKLLSTSQVTYYQN